MPTASPTPAESAGNEKSDLRRLADEFRAAVLALSDDPDEPTWRQVDDLYRALRDAMDADDWDELLAVARTLRAQQRADEPQWAAHPYAFILRFYDLRERRWKRSDDYRDQHNEVCTAWRKEHAEQTRQYDRDRAKTPERKAQIRDAQRRLRIRRKLLKGGPDVVH